MGVRFVRGRMILHALYYKHDKEEGQTGWNR